MILPFVFLIILCGVSFHLRGIWGHQIGGAVFGTLVGLGLSIIFKLPLSNTLELTFWLAIACAISAFVGWAAYENLKRFLRGYFAYGILPNIVIGIILFPNNLVAIIQIILLGGLGMGIGFGLSSPLLKWSRDYLHKKYEQNQKKKEEIENKRAKNLIFNEIDQEEEVSHVYEIKFNTWSYLMEVPSGLWYGLTTAIILALNIGSINPMETSISYIHEFYLVVLGLVIFVLCFIDGYKRKKKRNPFKVVAGQERWSEEKFKNASTITAIIGFIIAIDLIIFIHSLNAKILFLVFLWVINISARLSHEMDSKMFQIDLLFDFSCAFFLSIAIFYL